MIIKDFGKISQRKTPGQTACSGVLRKPREWRKTQGLMRGNIRRKYIMAIIY